eukprot:560531-Amphidinium_carterae.1
MEEVIWSCELVTRAWRRIWRLPGEPRWSCCGTLTVLLSHHRRQFHVRIEDFVLAMILRIPGPNPIPGVGFAPLEWLSTVVHNTGM